VRAREDDSGCALRPRPGADWLYPCFLGCRIPARGFVRLASSGFVPFYYPLPRNAHSRQSGGNIGEVSLAALPFSL